MKKINYFHPYKNGFEAAIAKDLGADYEYEPKSCRLAYTIEHVYVPDFVDHKNKIIREGKGLWDAEDRRKIKAVKAAHPDYTIIMVFQKPHKTISKTSKTTYAMWAEKEGIKWEQGPESLKKPRTKRT